MMATGGDAVPPDPTVPVPPLVLVVMGVSGCGKSTVAALVAGRLGWTFADGDDFHSAESVAKMQAGIPLDDADRAPWLARIAAWIAARVAASAPAVMVCSGLRRRYRDTITGGHPAVRIVYLEGSRTLIAARLAQRAGHFMPPALLDSQFAALEPPGPDENPIIVGVAEPPDRIAAAVVSAVRAGSPS
jgi:gluconokinase